MHELETARLILRPYTLDDIDFYASLWADPEVVRFIGDGVTRTREEARQRLAHIIAGYAEGFGLLAAWHKSEGQLVGHAGLVRQEIECEWEVELGYWFARRYWGQGLATEAAQALRDHAWRALGLRRIVSLIQPGNAASIAVAERVGMQLEREVEFRGKQVLLYAMGKRPVEAGAAASPQVF